MQDIIWMAGNIFIAVFAIIAGIGAGIAAGIAALVYLVGTAVDHLDRMDDERRK